MHPKRPASFIVLLAVGAVLTVACGSDRGGNLPGCASSRAGPDVRAGCRECPDLRFSRIDSAYAGRTVFNYRMTRPPIVAWPPPPQPEVSSV